MPALYDLDLHVQRVLKRSAKPVQHNPGSRQLSLFEMERELSENRS